MAETHKRRMSAPSSFITSWGAITLPMDLDILWPLPSTVKPWVSTCLYGETPRMAMEVFSDDWNQPRCWPEPSRYISARHWPSSSRTRSTESWVTPESNHTSRVSSTFSYWSASAPSSSCWSSSYQASMPPVSTASATFSNSSWVLGCSSWVSLWINRVIGTPQVR